MYNWWKKKQINAFSKSHLPKIDLRKVQCVSHLNSLPSPLSVLGVVCQSPHVHVALDDFWSQDVVSVAQPGCCGFTSTVKPERLRSQFGCWLKQKNKKIIRACFPTDLQLISNSYYQNWMFFPYFAGEQHHRTKKGFNYCSFNKKWLEV